MSPFACRWRDRDFKLGCNECTLIRARSSVEKLGGVRHVDAKFNTHQLLLTPSLDPALGCDSPPVMNLCNMLEL
ncbi:hypothetical protein KC19_7G107800 [Ceratodon purpureus]|uniref:Uncharacterized protein n=1 Tax=Ceratodon purpureus TaxID=3225 RepID=A0A8T0H9P9_CERPU|nr:hypothetical protein KC19_7G107800 [Ceratodon purpureus]